MVNAEFFLDGDGAVPPINISQDDFSGWISILGDPEDVPPEAEFYMDFVSPDRDPETEPITSTGRYQEQDWGFEPDWYQRLYSWRGYIPKGILNTDIVKPWYMDANSMAPYISEDCICIPRAAAKGFYQDFVCFDSLVEQLSLMDPFPPFQDFPHGAPPHFSIAEVLDVPFDSLASLRRAFTNAKRAILDRIGWLRWWTAVVPDADWEKKWDLSRADHLNLKSALKHDYVSRGYLLNLRRDWTEINIPLLLRQGVPIYYKWGHEEGAEPRLAKLNPRLIALSALEGTVALSDADSGDYLHDAERNTKKFDDFLQQKNSIPEVSHLSFETDSTFFIIDFEDWGRRRLPSSIDCNFYSSRFYFMTRTEEGDNPPIVTFWRWRKKISQLEIHADKPWNDLVECNDESILREAHKLQYAPSTDRIFDKETGLLHSGNND